MWNHRSLEPKGTQEATLSNPDFTNEDQRQQEVKGLPRWHGEASLTVNATRPPAPGKDQLDSPGHFYQKRAIETRGYNQLEIHLIYCFCFSI